MKRDDCTDKVYKAPDCSHSQGTARSGKLFNQISPCAPAKKQCTCIISNHYYRSHIIFIFLRCIICYFYTWLSKRVMWNFILSLLPQKIDFSKRYQFDCNCSRVKCNIQLIFCNISFYTVIFWYTIRSFLICFPD